MMMSSPFRRTTCLATICAFALTFSLADGAVARTEPPTSPAIQQSGPEPTPAARQTRLQIEHDPLACVTTVSAPVVEARIQPGPDLSKSYVYWRAAGTPYFYYTVMEGPVPEVKGVIPRPLPETTAVDYFVQATDRASLSRKTPEYAPPVVNSNVCKDNGLPVGVGGAGLTIGLTDEKQSPIPPGFNRADIAKVILVTGAVVGVSAALAASGGSAAASGAAAGAGTGAGAAGAGAGAAGAAAGGISTGVLVAGGAVAAAGIGYGVNQAVNNNNTSTPTPSQTPTATRTPTQTPVPNLFIEVEVTWSGGGKIDSIQLTKGGLTVSGQLLRAGCGSNTRTTRLIVQRENVTEGTYVVTVEGGTCGAGTPGEIAALLAVQTSAGQKCSGIIRVPTNGSRSIPYPACTFSLP